MGAERGGLGVAEEKREDSLLGLCHCLPSATGGHIITPGGGAHFTDGCCAHGGIGTGT